jgi:hypothetical protein
MKDGIVNAIVLGVSLDDDDDRGILTGCLQLDYGNSWQDFGGYTLYSSKSFSQHDARSGFAGHFIWRCMEIAGVSSWDKIKGKAIRVRIVDGRAESVGHIIKDDWFSPKDDWSNQP